MKFELGKFFKHEAGRAIAIVGEVDTYAWGKVYIVEETDPTGHGISCIEKGSADTHERWVEIGKEEWMREFKNVRAVH